MSENLKLTKYDVYCRQYKGDPIDYPEYCRNFTGDRKELSEITVETKTVKEEPVAEKKTTGGANSMCFTLNNYTEIDIDILKNVKCKYIVFGKEVGERGTPHLQGYVEWSSTKLWSTVHKMFDGRTHWEKRKSNDARDAANYCKKGEQSHSEWHNEGIKGKNFGLNADVYEFGQISRQGNRTDLAEVAYQVDTNVAMADIALNAPETYIRYHKGILNYKMTTKAVHRTEAPYVEWRWGTSGVGKTYGVKEKETSFYIKDGTMWWDGYNFEPAILIDDFDGKWPYRDFLRLLDFNPYQGQIKGGYVEINSPRIYITCEFHPNRFWSGNELAQVCSRMDKVVHVTGENVRLQRKKCVEYTEEKGEQIFHQNFNFAAQVAAEGGG